MLYLKDGAIGHVEQIDEDNFVDVRWLTPNNEPSICISVICDMESLVVVSDSVVPKPMPERWWKASREFCSAIEEVLNELEEEC